MSESRVTIEHRDGVADVRLARPEKLNAIDAAMFQALAESGEKLAADRSLRAVVLSGEGRGFCAGLDFQSFATMRQRHDGNEELLRAKHGPANRAQRAAWIWQEVPVPVIAAVHGVAYGGGLQIALGADLRYVHPEAQLSIMEIRWGLVPDMSGTQTLRRLMRLDLIKELTFTGRIVSGTEAVQIGLATRQCDDPRADALATAAEIAKRSPDAIRSAKQLLNQSGLLDLEQGLALEASSQKALIGTPNQTEAVQANLERRAPRFVDPMD